MVPAADIFLGMVLWDVFCRSQVLLSAKTPKQEDHHVEYLLFTAAT
jgi:hypothetical protein